MKPRLLDLFCCAGGAGQGYALAGFEVVGVDVTFQPRYPFQFVCDDAMKVLEDLARDGHAIGRHFDAIHASPPCQMYSRALKHLSAPQPMLIDAVRDLLIEIGLPYVIENVEGSPLPRQSDLFGAHGVELCGTMFGLPVWRHRLFECSFPVPIPRPCDHSRPAMNPHNQLGRDRIYAEFGRNNVDLIWNRAMGVGWMSKEEGREAIPPAMTHYVGRYLAAQVRERQKEAA